MAKNKAVTSSKITTIKLLNATKARLDGLKEYERETYDEVLNKILNIVNIAIRNPLAGAKIFSNIKRKKIGKQKIQEKLLARQETQMELEAQRNDNNLNNSETTQAKRSELHLRNTSKPINSNFKR
jgi:hypothetical protein